jgi:hypothetical protein
MRCFLGVFSDCEFEARFRDFVVADARTGDSDSESEFLSTSESDSDTSVKALSVNSSDGFSFRVVAFGRAFFRSDAAGFFGVVEPLLPVFTLFFKAFVEAD